jgi:hypothetical protein
VPLRILAGVLIIRTKVAERNLYTAQGSGYFFHDKMPVYRLPGLAAATALQFTACRIQHPLSLKQTASFAYPGGSNHLLIRGTGAIILT